MTLLLCGLALLLAFPDAASIQQRIQEGQLEEARAELQQLLQNRPNDPGLLNLLGVVAAQSRNTQAAEKNFLAALRSAPDSVSIYENLGRLYQNADIFDAPVRAEKVYRKILAFQPGNQNARYQLALALLKQNRYKASLQTIGGLSNELQFRPQALGVTLVARTGLKENTGDLVTRFAAHPQLTERDAIELTRLLEKQHREALAIPVFESLLRQQKLQVAGLWKLGLLYQSKGSHAIAIQHLEQAAARVEPNASLLQSLARSSYELHDYTKTLGYLAQARDLDPNNAAVHFFFGMTSVAADLATEARFSLEKAVRLAPKNPFYNYAYGAILVAGGEREAAVPYFLRYHQLRPEDQRGKLALGIAYFLSGNSTAAEPILRECAVKPETSAGALFFLGRLERQRKQYEQAIENFKKSFLLNPSNIEAQVELGQIYLLQKDYPDAEKELLAVVRHDPNHYKANLSLLQLYQRTGDTKKAAQKARFEKAKQHRAEQEKTLWRTLKIVPYRDRVQR